jgi:hypothetical protein
LEVDDEACSTTQIQGMNRRKTPQIVTSKIGSKIHLNITKIKTLQLKIGDDLTQTHGYIDANQEFTRCGNYPNIIPLFERLEISLTSLLSSLRHEAHPHLTK